MIKKILICAVIALILVPATVLAAGPGGQNNSAVSGQQGQCLQNGGTGSDQACAMGSGSQAQYRNGGQQNGENCTRGNQNGQCTHEQKQTRTMSSLHDGSCTGCRNVPAAQP
ncbi:MAG: hypothetical protein WC379_04355 [Methanoregula sp.]